MDICQDDFRMMRSNAFMSTDITIDLKSLRLGVLGIMDKSLNIGTLLEEVVEDVHKHWSQLSWTGPVCLLLCFPERGPFLT